VKLNKFGTVSEENGRLLFGGFDIDPQGKPISSEDQLLECCLDLVIERLKKVKQARVDARQIAFLEDIPIAAMFNA
jgi:hypothetical protein